MRSSPSVLFKSLLATLFLLWIALPGHSARAFSEADCETWANTITDYFGTDATYGGAITCIQQFPTTGFGIELTGEELSQKVNSYEKRWPSLAYPIEQVCHTEEVLKFLMEPTTRKDIYWNNCLYFLGFCYRDAVKVLSSVYLNHLKANPIEDCFTQPFAGCELICTSNEAHKTLFKDVCNKMRNRNLIEFDTNNYLGNSTSMLASLGCYPILSLDAHNLPTINTPVKSGYCGNGVVEAPEQCDKGINNGKAGSTCTKTCKFLISAVRFQGNANRTQGTAGTPVNTTIPLWFFQRR